MGEFRLSITSRMGRLTLTATTLKELKSQLQELGWSSKSTTEMLRSFTTISEVLGPTKEVPKLAIPSSVPELTGIIEFTNDGSPHLTYKGQLTDQQVIGLLLYAKGATSIAISDLRELVQENYKAMRVEQVGANLSKMRPYIIKQGSRGSYTYRLSGAGRSWIENQILPKLRKGPEES
jgi:hypothetical protein